MRSHAPRPAHRSNILGSNYVAMQPYSLILSVFLFSIVFGSFFLLFSFSSLLYITDISVILRVFSRGPKSILIHLGSKLMYIPVRPYVLTFFMNVMSPAPPIAAALILTELLMINRKENTPRNVPVWQKIRQSIPQLI